MKPTSVEEELRMALEENPGDWPRWLVLADFYEDIGLSTFSTACRFCAANQKRPLYQASGFYIWTYSNRDDGRVSHSLPYYLFGRIKRVNNNDNWSLQQFQSLNEALLALGKALEE